VHCAHPLVLHLLPDAYPLPRSCQVLPLFAERSRSRTVGVLEIVQTVPEMDVAQVITTMAAFLQVRHIIWQWQQRQALEPFTRLKMRILAAEQAVHANHDRPPAGGPTLRHLLTVPGHDAFHRADVSLATSKDPANPEL